MAAPKAARRSRCRARRSSWAGPGAFGAGDRCFAGRRGSGDRDHDALTLGSIRAWSMSTMKLASRYPVAPSNVMAMMAG